MHRWDVYRGRRSIKYGGITSALAIFLLIVVIALVTMFFLLPSYLTYTKESVKLDLPFLQEAEEAWEESQDPWADMEQPGIAAEPEEVHEDYTGLTAQIEVRSPDYSALSYSADADVEILQSIYVPYENVNDDGLAAAIAACKSMELTALTLELKDETGQLLWQSETETALGYALSGTWNMKDTLADLKSRGFYLTAVISTCVDSSLVSRNAPAALKDAAGFPYSDSFGAWLDPWSSAARKYAIELTTELMLAGFDEVVLDHVAHPTVDVNYSRAMSGSLTREAAVTNFAIAVRKGVEETMKATGAHLSVMMDPQRMNNAESYDNGQNLSYLINIFDRVYCVTSTYSEASQVVALGVDSTERFVAIIPWIFEGGSWAYDYFAEKDE